MNIVKPDASKFLLPPGAQELSIRRAPGMAGCADLPAIMTPDGKIASQWLPTPNELEQLNAGQPVTLVVYTFHNPIAPVSVMVGGANLQ